MFKEKLLPFDFAKFLCVFFMVFVHCSFWLISVDDKNVNIDNFLFPIINNSMFLGLFPLSIPFFAGVTLKLHLNKFLKNQTIHSYPFSMLVKISVFLIAASFLMNLFTWGIRFLEWDVLQFIAISFMFIVIILKFLNHAFLVIITFAILFLSPYLRDILINYDNFFTAILVGTQRRESFWPFFPWFFTISIGYFAAHYYFAFKNLLYWKIGITFLGLLLFLVGLLSGSMSIMLDPKNIWGSNIFQPSNRFILGIVGFSFLLLTFSIEISDRFEFSQYGIVNSFSKGILWIYLLHTVFGVHFSLLMRKITPLEIPALLFPSITLLFSWGVGAFSIFLGSKRFRISFTKA